MKRHDTGLEGVWLAQVVLVAPVSEEEAHLQRVHPASADHSVLGIGSRGKCWQKQQGAS